MNLHQIKEEIKRQSVLQGQAHVPQEGETQQATPSPHASLTHPLTPHKPLAQKQQEQKEAADIKKQKRWDANKVKIEKQKAQQEEKRREREKAREQEKTKSLKEHHQEPPVKHPHLDQKHKEAAPVA